MKYIRQQFSAATIELRVDANSAFAPKEALEKLKRLSTFELHSIEQPIRQYQWQEMAALCAETPLKGPLLKVVHPFTLHTGRRWHPEGIKAATSEGMHTYNTSRGSCRHTVKLFSL